ncbi:MAG: hypothetical protein ABIR96_01885, partial [Bdellovibrionota bacterium]
MKEKIRALWAKIAPKVDPVLERIRVVSNRVLPHIGKHSRWVSYFVAVPILFTCIAGLGFFWIYPAYELRPWVTEKLVSQLKAQSLKVGEMSWDHSLSQLSLGVELKDIEIQKGAWFHSLKVDELRLSFSPIALLTAGTPFNLEANGLDANLKLSSPRRFVRPSKEVPAAPTTKSEQLVEWTRKLLSYAKGYKIKLERSKIQLELPVGAEDAQIPNMLQINLQDVDLEAELDASWRQKIHLKALAQAGTKSGSWILAGPLGLESQSTLSVREEDIPVSLDFKKFDLDLSETNFTGWGALERFAPGKFVIQAKPRVLFREEDSQLVIGELISGESHAFLDDLKIDLTSRYQPRKEFQLEWLVGRSEVKSLHLPLKWLRRAPGAGIVSSMGRLQLRERLDNSDFTWRFALNNFKIDAADLATIWGDQNSSSGPVLVSAVSEGRLQNGRLDSPRTEVQIDATAAEWDPPGSVFAKPAGHKAQLLLRMSHDDGGLKVSHLDLEMHTLKLEGQGHLKNLLGLLLSDEAAPYDLSLVSNNVDLSEWTSLFPSFRKIPLQGFFQTKGDFYGTYDPKDENTWSKIGWNFEKFHLSNIAGAFQRGENIDVAGMRQDMSGPFSMSFFFVGRGEGTRVNRATLLSQADLTNASIWFGEKFRKPQGTPLVFQFSADQSRNRVHIDKGSFRLADLDMNFSGDMIQGLGRSRLKVLLKDPIDLSTWKEFFPDAKLQQRV